MKKRIVAIVAACSLAIPLFAGHGGGGGSHGSGSSSGASKTVYVHSYTKSDGTHVNGYWRAAPGTANARTTLTTTQLNSAAPINTTVATTNETAMVTRTKPNAAAVKAFLHEPVLADANTKRYYRETCSAPPSAVMMSRSSAIAAGYRPDPTCYATR